MKKQPGAEITKVDNPETGLLRRHKPRRRLPPVSVLPTLFTLGNLVAGFAAIHYAAKPLGSMESMGSQGLSSLTLAGILIFLGMFFDAVDGSVARMTRSVSDLGAQIDSLADMVTFGVAPAFMMLRLVSYYVGPQGEITILGPEADDSYARVIWGIAVVYACCTALRLARFNIETPSAAVEDHMVFRGLPSPGAAGAVASLVALHQHLLFVKGASPDDVTLSFARWTAFGIPFVTLLCALAMVSSIPYVHVLNRYVRGKRSFAYLARLVVPLLMAIWWFQETLAICFTAYALSGPLRLLGQRWGRKIELKGTKATPQN